MSNRTSGGRSRHKLASDEVTTEYMETMTRCMGQRIQDLTASLDTELHHFKTDTPEHHGYEPTTFENDTIRGKTSPAPVMSRSSNFKDNETFASSALSSRLRLGAKQNSQQRNDCFTKNQSTPKMAKELIHEPTTYNRCKITRLSLIAKDNETAKCPISPRMKSSCVQNEDAKPNSQQHNECFTKNQSTPKIGKELFHEQITNNRYDTSRLSSITKVNGTAKCPMSPRMRSSYLQNEDEHKDDVTQSMPTPSNMNNIRIMEMNNYSQRKYDEYAIGKYEKCRYSKSPTSQSLSQAFEQMKSKENQLSKNIPSNHESKHSYSSYKPLDSTATPFSNDINDIASNGRTFSNKESQLHKGVSFKQEGSQPHYSYKPLDSYTEQLSNDLNDIAPNGHFETEIPEELVITKDQISKFRSENYIQKPTTSNKHMETELGRFYNEPTDIIPNGDFENELSGNFNSTVGKQSKLRTQKFIKNNQASNKQMETDLERYLHKHSDSIPNGYFENEVSGTNSNVFTQSMATHKGRDSEIDWEGQANPINKDSYQLPSTVHKQVIETLSGPEYGALKTTNKSTQSDTSKEQQVVLDVVPTLISNAISYNFEADVSQMSLEHIDAPSQKSVKHTDPPSQMSVKHTNPPSQMSVKHTDPPSLIDLQHADVPSPSKTTNKSTQSVTYKEQQVEHADHPSRIDSKHTDVPSPSQISFKHPENGDAKEISVKYSSLKSLTGYAEIERLLNLGLTGTPAQSVLSFGSKLKDGDGGTDVVSVVASNKNVGNGVPSVKRLEKELEHRPSNQSRKSDVAIDTPIFISKTSVREEPLSVEKLNTPLNLSVEKLNTPSNLSVKTSNLNTPSNAPTTSVTKTTCCQVCCNRKVVCCVNKENMPGSEKTCFKDALELEEFNERTFSVLSRDQSITTPPISSNIAGTKTKFCQFCCDRKNVCCVNKENIHKKTSFKDTALELEEINEPKSMKSLVPRSSHTSSCDQNVRQSINVNRKLSRHQERGEPNVVCQCADQAITCTDVLECVEEDCNFTSCDESCSTYFGETLIKRESECGTKRGLGSVTRQCVETKRECTPDGYLSVLPCKDLMHTLGVVCMVIVGILCNILFRYL